MTNKTTQPTPLLDSTDVLALLNLRSIRTLDQWAHRRVGPPYVRIGKHRRYRIEDVEKWIASQTRGGTPR